MGTSSGGGTNWQSVYENSLDGVLLTSPSGAILAANPQACALLGRTEEEIRAAGRAGVAVANEAAARFMEERQRLGRASGVLTLRRKDGTTFLAEVCSAVFVDASGEQRTSMSFRDVTERERARHALEILADAGQVLADSLDPRATLTNLTSLVVPRLADVCAVDLLEGGDVKRVAVAHRDPTRSKDFIGVRRPVTLEGAIGGVDHVLRTGEPSAVFEVTDAWLRAVTHDEAHFQAARGLGIRSFVATPLIARGRTIGALTLMSDGGVPPFTEGDLPLVRALAERAALALDNARQHRDAVEARRLRDEVLGIVSHDLRNPLNAILLNAGLLRHQAPGRELEAIKTAVHRADRLIQDLLLAARTEGGRLELVRRSESVASMLEGVAGLHRSLAEAQEITFVVAAAEDAGEVSVDRHRIVQMLSNLVGNALKFTPRGGRVELRASAEAEGVRLTVTDSGRGIAKEELPRVFDRFWQGAHARDAGVGLGLSIARGIAEAHGGSIAVESQPGVGTTFTVRLPRGEGARIARQPPESPLAATS